MQDNSYIYGKNAVFEAILSENSDIEKIFLCFGINNSQVQFQAKKQKIHYTTLDKKKFRELEQKVCPYSANSQGVIALRALVKTIELSDFLNSLQANNPVLVIVDGITDPHNLGAISRSAECAGACAIIITDKGNVPINPTVIKTSAGAFNHLKVIKVKNLINACERLKDNGFWIIGTDVSGKESYTDNIYDKPVVVIIGSEGKGMSASLKKHCDHLVRINMFGKINSLNASVSAGVILFEIQRQRSII